MKSSETRHPPSRAMPPAIPSPRGSFTRVFLALSLTFLAGRPSGAQDTIPPRLVSVTSATGSEITVRFSEPMGTAGLTVPANYQVTSGSVSVAVSSARTWPTDSSMVVLALVTPVSGSFTVTVRGVRDASGNPITAGASIAGRVWDDPPAVRTVGAMPNPPPQLLALEDGHLLMRSGGSLFYGSDASFPFAYVTRTNDFDMQVRLNSLVKESGADSPLATAAALSARSVAEPTNIALYVAGFPSNGSMLETWRIEDDNVTAPSSGSEGRWRWGQSMRQYPIWLRLRRTGITFYFFVSASGADWMELGDPKLAPLAPAVMEIGLLTASYGAGIFASAEFEGFGDTPLGSNAGLRIVQQPSDATAEAGHSATVSAEIGVAGASEADLIYQWQGETAVGSGVFTNAFLASHPRYVSPRLSLDESGRRVRLLARFSGGPAILSHPVRITVEPDTHSPRLLSAVGVKGWSELLLTFSEPVGSDEAEDAFNYEGNDFGVLTATLDPTGTKVTLTLLTALDPSTPHAITVSEVRDRAGNPIAPAFSMAAVLDPTVTGVLERGAAREEFWFGIGGTSISSLTSNSRYPDSPDWQIPVSKLEALRNYVDNYGGRISGFLLPPVTGSYHFWMASDDEGEFWLSTDANPINRILICREPSWNAARSYNSLIRRNPDAPENRSSTLFPDGIPLVAGQPYYLEALFKEGPSDDHCAVAWQVPGGPTPRDGGGPIPGVYLASRYERTTTPTLRIIEEPHDALARRMPVTATGPRILASHNFTLTDGGFSVRTAGNLGGAWRLDPGVGGWATDGDGTGWPLCESLLTSPPVTVARPGEVQLRFQHRHSFEEPMWDGGLVRISVNGGAFQAVPGSAFVSNGYTGLIVGDGALTGQEAFGNMSSNYATLKLVTSVARLGLFEAGDTLAIQFQAAWDWNTLGSNPNWLIRNVELTEGHPGTAPASFTFAVNVRRDDNMPAPISYVWQRDCGTGFADILGANDATYSFLPVPADLACRYRCIAYTPGASITSRVATVAVGLSGLRLTRSGAQVIANWPGGMLQRAADVAGPWEDITTNGPLPFLPSEPRRFYRLRDPNPLW